MKSSKAEDLMSTTTTSYETAPSVPVRKRDRKRKKSDYQDEQMAAVMELIHSIEADDDAARRSQHGQTSAMDGSARRPPDHPAAQPPQGSGTAPARADTFPQIPHAYKSERAAPKESSSKSAAKEDAKPPSLSEHAYPPVTPTEGAQKGDTPKASADAKGARSKSDAVAGTSAPPPTDGVAVHDAKVPDIPKAEDKGEAKEEEVQSSKVPVVPSLPAQPQAGKEVPEPPKNVGTAKRKRRPSKFCCGMIMVLLVLFAVALALATATLGYVERFNDRDHPVLKGVFGTVRGARHVLTDQGRELPVFAFLGIPYAKPPLRERRFRPPVPLDKEEDVKRNPLGRQGKRPPCPQQDFYLGKQNVSTTNASEDCLHLNIWTPPWECEPEKERAECKLRTVLFFLYGAAFQNGANSFELYDGQYLSALGDLVVVVPNYRVGALGFLSGPSRGVLPGNAGLYDQRLALSWTLSNIEIFGGNASRLVLAGHDAGAASLGYHLFYGDADLFTRNVARYILQGGGPFSRYKDDGLEGAHLLATNLQCGNDLSAPVTLRCLQNSDVDAVARSPLASRFVPLLNRTPVSHPQPRRKASDRGEKRKETGPQGKQFLLGRVVLEGVYPWFVEHQRTGSNDPLYLATHLIGRKALEEWQTATGTTLRPSAGDTLYQEAVGDVLVACPMSEMAEVLQAWENRVYAYILGYRPRYSSWLNQTEAVRFEDMHMVFGMPLRPDVPSSELDKQWSRTMIRVWSTFAHTGKAPVMDGSKWPVYDPLRPAFMKLGVDGMSMEPDTRRARCDFLRSHHNPY
ncbi:acetylcholinesterase-1-like isoform X2 [Dermacentor albipictus]|uniref:acetylcholinesterase-1-like isoform X2 n=1 Tax=Dermacentor albipictus TaxID=60249 RepID=UPI0031FC8E39